MTTTNSTTNSTTNAASNQQLEPELLPCPFCGIKVLPNPMKDSRTWHPIMVNECPLGKVIIDWPIDQWNTRSRSAGGVVATVDDMKVACDEAVASLNREGKWTVGDVGNYMAAFYSGWCARETFAAPPAAPASPAPSKEEARAKCANCGESIIRDGNEWDHEFPYRPECLNAIPFATTPSPDAAREITREIKRRLAIAKTEKANAEKGRYDRDALRLDGVVGVLQNLLEDLEDGTAITASTPTPEDVGEAANAAADKIADYFNAPPSVIPAIEQIIRRYFPLPEYLNK